MDDHMFPATQSLMPGPDGDLVQEGLAEVVRDGIHHVVCENDAGNLVQVA